MNAADIQISKIISRTTSKQKQDCFTVCWIQQEVEQLEINQNIYRKVANSVFFLHPDHDWKIWKTNASEASGYVMYLPRPILEDPIFKNLHITEVRLFSNNEIPRIHLAPGIEKRVQAILEMLDELISTNLNHREEAILSLLNTFFVYCDGKCNIKSVINHTGSKAILVYKFKKILDRSIGEYHRVGDYAGLLNVTDKYLNECVSEVMGVRAKSLIDEQLVMRSRHQLRFSDMTIKEVAFGMGFTSADYFSSYFKKHTGHTPSGFRKL